MRTTILPSMLEILTRNYNYRNKAVRLYEIGKVYFARPDGMADEPKLLCLGGYGGGMDFFQLKGAVERILAGLRIADVTFEAENENPSYHPGRCARSTPAASCWAYSARSTRSPRQTTAWTQSSTQPNSGSTACSPPAAPWSTRRCRALPGCDARRRHRLQRGHPGRQALGVILAAGGQYLKGLRAV